MGLRMSHKGPVVITIQSACPWNIHTHEIITDHVRNTQEGNVFTCYVCPQGWVGTRSGKGPFPPPYREGDIPLPPPLPSARAGPE